MKTYRKKKKKEWRRSLRNGKETKLPHNWKKEMGLPQNGKETKLPQNGKKETGAGRGKLGEGHEN